MPEAIHPYIAVARSTIAGELGLRTAASGRGGDPELHRRGAAFVRIGVDGRLRGSLGTVRAVRSLVADIAVNALNAAFHDPRFAPLSAEEFDRMAIEVAIVTSVEPLEVRTRQELAAVLLPEVDGLLLERGGRRASFMPTAWRSAPTPDDFVAGLMRKAGRPADFWADGIRATRFRTRLFGDPLVPVRELLGDAA